LVVKDKNKSREEAPELVDENDIISLDGEEQEPEERTDELYLPNTENVAAKEPQTEAADAESLDESTMDEDTSEVGNPAPEDSGDSSVAEDIEDTGRDAVSTPQAEATTSPYETVDEPLVSRRRRRLEEIEWDKASVAEDNTPQQEEVPPWQRQPALPSAEKTQILGQDGPDAKTQILGGENEEKPLYPVLVVMSGEDEGREIEVVPDHAVLGRGTDCDLVFPDIACSRRHASISREDGRVYITDLNSGNGTMVNGKRIQKMELHDGDEIRIGTTVLRFQFPQAAPAPASRQGKTVTRQAPLAPTTGFVGNLLADPRRRKLILFGGGGVVGLIVLLAVVKMFLPARPVGPSPEEVNRARQLQAKEEYEQHFAAMKDYIKDKKWAEAMLEIQLAQKLKPGDTFLQEYKAHIEKEQAAEEKLKAALLAMGERSCDRVTELVSQVPRDSVYSERALSLLKECEAKIIEDMLKQGRQLMEEKKYSQAALLFDDVLKKSPEEGEALRLKVEAEKLAAAEASSHQKPVRQTVKKKVLEAKPKKKSASAQVLALYRSGELAKALEVAENEGASQQAATLKKIKALLEQARQMVRSQAEAVKAIEKLEEVRRLDETFADGQGKVSQEVHEMLAKCYFLQGADAKLSKKYPEAYKAFRMAEKYGNQMAAKNLEDLKKIAKRLYEEAYIIKSSNPDQAIAKLEVVVKIIPPDDPYYGKGQKLLSSLRSPGAGTHDSEGEF